MKHYYNSDPTHELRQEIAKAKQGFAALSDVPAFLSAVKLAKAVNVYITTVPDHYAGHADQLHRAAVSVVANIAESHGRRTPAQLVQYVRVACGSAWETLALLLIADPPCPELVDMARETVRLCDDLLIELATNRL